MIPREYVMARAVLLDALDALGPHRDAVVLVGAQAVYVHSGDGDFSTAPTTTDADLALIPDRLADEPSIVAAMRAAGFVPGSQPGSWVGVGQIMVDLMAPEALCGPTGRRSADLRPPHDDKDTARRTLGLEAAVVDNEFHVIAALASEDSRAFRDQGGGTRRSPRIESLQDLGTARPATPTEAEGRARRASVAACRGHTTAGVEAQ